MLVLLNVVVNVVEDVVLVVEIMDVVVDAELVSTVGPSARCGGVS